MVQINMSNITKGQDVLLSEIDPGLKRIMVGLGWDVPENKDGNPVDLDASAFLLNTHDKTRQDTDFVFYNNLETEKGNIRHMGDNNTGEGDGDDEKIEINLGALPYDVAKIVFSVTIHNCRDRQQNFGMVTNAYIRVVNLDTNTELARFDLSEDASDEDGFIFGELSRDMGGWKFTAIGLGSIGGLYKIARGFNVNVAPN